MYRSARVVGVMSVFCGTMTLGAFAAARVSPPAGTRPDVHAARASSAKPRITVDAVGASYGVTYYVELRNAGSEPVDVSGFGLAGDDHSAPLGVKLELVRGSFTMGPGETAVILTHPAVPSDDEPRSLYTHVYRYLTSGGESALATGDGLSLVDAAGEIIDPIVGADTRVGDCCDKRDYCTCKGPVEFCYAFVSGNVCCQTYGGCCWAQTQGQTACINNQCNMDCSVCGYCP